MRQNVSNRMRMLVILVWSGIFCLASLATSAEAVHPSTTKTQAQLVDHTNQKSLLSSDQTSLQPQDPDATETDKTQTIDDAVKTYLEIDNDNRDRENDDNWTGYSLVLPDLESNGVEEDVERLPNNGEDSGFSNLKRRAWKASGRPGNKEGGKRKWSSTNLAMWGKRKWAANNMAMWGKRDARQPEKRKWNGNSMAMWGKRDLSGQELDEEKRKWNGNSMAMWGKRDLVQNGSTEPEWQRVVRGWSGSNLAMWGKRDIAKKLSH